MRRNIHWRNGARCVVLLTVDVDGETLWLSRDPALADRPLHMSMGAYGPKEGVPRILEVLDRYRIKAGFFIPGWTMERYPDLTKEIHARGHEIGHHGYLHEKPAYVNDRAQEEAALLKGLEVFDKLLGTRPAGYRTPSAEPSKYTFALLAKHGFRYHSNLMDRDIPYWLSTEHGPILELPTAWVLDDFVFFGHSFNPPVGHGIRNQDDVYGIWAEEFEGMYEEGGYFHLMMHPQVIGRPHRMRMVERLIQRMVGKGDVWFARPIDLVEHWAAQSPA